MDLNSEIQFKELQDPNMRSQICEKVLRALPQWFGIESAILDYVDAVKSMETWAAIESEVIGFISLKKHNAQSAEIQIMGILPDFHRKGIGTGLIRIAAESLHSQGFKFLTVKTLSDERRDPNYNQTRKFYLQYGFTPIEEFKTLWGNHNPCLLLIKSIAPAGQFAVIFTSRRTPQDGAEYEIAAERMMELAKIQPGFLGAESVRDKDGFGITVSYWRSLADIRNWKLNSEHLAVQEMGRTRWYESFTLRICRIERMRNFSKETNSPEGLRGDIG